jgi:hypothetical protein
VLAVRRLFEQLGLWEMLDRFLGKAKTVSFADRALVLVANRLIRPASEHGHRYYTWRLDEDAFAYEPSANLAREKRMEGKYVIATTEKNLDAPEAVRIYKELTEVERGFRHLKDVLAMRPIYHRIAPRVKGHIFVAALGISDLKPPTPPKEQDQVM